LRLPRRVLNFLWIFGEALTRVSRQYKEIAAAQAGEQTWFAVGAWLRDVPLGDIDKVRATLDEPEHLREGWWDSAPPVRRCLFMAMTVEASTPERASLRCLEELVARFEKQGVTTAQAVRIEVEPLEADLIPIANAKRDAERASETAEVNQGAEAA
jgi:hypothetical protein